MKQSNIKQPLCEACLQRSIAQLKSAAFKYCVITEPLKNKSGCDEGLLAMRNLAEMIENTINDASTHGNQLGLMFTLWDAPSGVSDAYIRLATAIVDAVKLIQSQSKVTPHE
jgi:hypothetical protein